MEPSSIHPKLPDNVSAARFLKVGHLDLFIELEKIAAAEAL